MTIIYNPFIVTGSIPAANFSYREEELKTQNQVLPTW